jgi:hypothetical protein
MPCNLLLQDVLYRISANWAGALKQGFSSMESSTSFLYSGQKEPPYDYYPFIG